MWLLFYDSLIIKKLHNYSETNSIQNRKLNWLQLNKKVLKNIRCDLGEDDVEIFSTRRSAERVVEYLRSLRAKLQAYEPLYLAGQYSVDPAAQARTASHLSTARPSSSASHEDEDMSTMTASAYRRKSMHLHTMSHNPASSSTSTISSGSNNKSLNGSMNTSTATDTSKSMRRPSMMKSEQLLKRSILIFTHVSLYIYV